MTKQDRVYCEEKAKELVKRIGLKLSLDEFEKVVLDIYKEVQLEKFIDEEEKRFIKYLNKERQFVMDKNGKIVRESMPLDIWTGFSPRKLKKIEYQEAVLQVFKEREDGVVEVFAETRYTFDRETNFERFREMLGEEFRDKTIREMFWEYRYVKKFNTKVRVRKVKSGMGYKPENISKKYEERKERVELDKIYAQYVRDTEFVRKNRTIKDKKGRVKIKYLSHLDKNRTIYFYKAGVYIDFKAKTGLDRYANEYIKYFVAEPNELGIDIANRYLTEFKVNGDFMTQNEFDMVYKMFGERTDRNSEQELELNNIIDEILDEMYWD